MKNRTLESAPNIGKTILRRLNNIGIFTLADLSERTPALAYKHMCDKANQTNLPVCYYLYSLEGALMDMHWTTAVQDV